MKNFNQLGLSKDSLDAIKIKGFEEPTEIQQKIIPVLLTTDLDIIGQAQTGTGKTAAFGLPILERMRTGQKHVQVLILTPTRELAIQVAEEINSIKGEKKFRIAPIYGGQSIEGQLRKLKKGIDIVVGTPGRIIDHIRRRTLDLSKISFFILDEADEMLNMGFIDDIEKILKSANSVKRFMLFSATMPSRIRTLASKYMKKHEYIKTQKKDLTVAKTDQIYFEVSSSDKFDALCRIIDIEPEFYALIFCRTKINVKSLMRKLADRGYDVDAIHGDLSQSLRERILSKFKNRQINILVATDVAARGIDIIDLTHVINYSLPQDPEGYIHRIGRTGRAGKRGTAITFITSSEYRKLNVIKRIAQTDIEKAKLPGIKDVIKVREKKIKDNIQNIINDAAHTKYYSLAEELLAGNSEKDIIAALIKSTFKDELDTKDYSEIKEATPDSKGKTRLFVARGRKNNLTPNKLKQLIKEKVHINDHLIQDIEVLDDFSFLTVPFIEAELILDAFLNSERGRKSLIVKAKTSQRKKERKKRKKKIKYCIAKQ